MEGSLLHGGEGFSCQNCSGVTTWRGWGGGVVGLPARISTQPGPRITSLLLSRLPENVSIGKFFPELNSEALQCPVTCPFAFAQHLLGDALCSTPLGTGSLIKTCLGLLLANP